MSIILNHVSHIYSQGGMPDVRALDDVNLTIEQGELLALIGHTGSGKSTLVMHLNGLLRPDSGEILLDGEDINARDYKRVALRSKVGVVFQYPEYQLFETEVLKDVCFGPQNTGLSLEEAEKRAFASLGLTGVPKERWHCSPFELSGGEKRRVAIAGVLAMKPEYFVLDEPTAGLDPHGRRELLDMIKTMAENGIGVVMVSHNMDDVAEYADRVAVMDKGRVIMNGSPSDVFRRRAELEAIGLGVPAVCEIVEDLQGAGLCSDGVALDIEGAARLIMDHFSSRMSGRYV